MTTEQEKGASEIAAALASAPRRTFKLFRGTGTGVEENIEAHLQNFSSVGQRIERAKTAGCLIEVISLRLQIMDFWLRMFFVNTVLAGKRCQREFGRLLDQCKELGLSQELHQRLKELNKHRVAAIHGYVAGKTTYERLLPVVEESKSLSADLIVFVIQNCGVAITSTDFLEGYHNIGDMILNVPAEITHIRSTL